MITKALAQLYCLQFFQIRIMRSELGRLNHELQAQNETIKDNEKKIKQNKVLPYLVSNIIEVLDVNPEDEEEIEGANVDLDSQRKGKSVVIKTTTRQTYFLPVAGLVEPEKLKPGDLVGVNKVSFSLVCIHCRETKIPLPRTHT